MAIYHLSVKTISRSTGRSATAAAAYRASAEIADERTGEVHDYRRKRGVVSAELALPANAPSWAQDRSALWNAAEQSETRKNSTVAREFEVALPAELSADERRSLALRFAHELCEGHGFAADVAIHEPGQEGDQRNYHAHILTTTRRLGPEGFTEKCRELDDQKSGKVMDWRKRWGELVNEALERSGNAERVDHRSFAAQGKELALAGVHLGPAASAIERRGEVSERAERLREIYASKIVMVEKERLKRPLLFRIEQARGFEDSFAHLAVAPMGAQVKVYRSLVQSEKDQRDERVTRVLAKAAQREERRREVLSRVLVGEPKQPEGTFAAFTAKTFEQAKDLWERSQEQTRRLVDQAGGLVQQLKEAGDRALDWARSQVAERLPDLAKRVDGYQEEMARAFGRLPKDEALALHPELKTTYEVFERAVEIAKADAPPAELAGYTQYMKSQLVDQLGRGELIQNHDAPEPPEPGRER